jgi:hypothetical protein
MLTRVAAFSRRLLDATATFLAAVRTLDQRLVVLGLVVIGAVLIAGLVTPVVRRSGKESTSNPLNSAVHAACRETDVDAVRVAERIRGYREEGKSHAEACALIRQGIPQGCGITTTDEVDLGMLLCMAVRYHALASVVDSVYGEPPKEGVFISSVEMACRSISVDSKAAAAGYEEMKTAGAFPGESRSESLAFACESCGYATAGDVDAEMVTCITRHYHAIQAVADSIFARRP